MEVRVKRRPETESDDCLVVTKIKYKTQVRNNTGTPKKIKEFEHHINL